MCVYCVVTYFMFPVFGGFNRGSNGGTFIIDQGLFRFSCCLFLLLLSRLTNREIYTTVNLFFFFFVSVQKPTARPTMPQLAPAAQRAASATLTGNSSNARQPPPPLPVRLSRTTSFCLSVCWNRNFNINFYFYETAHLGQRCGAAAARRRRSLLAERQTNCALVFGFILFVLHCDLTVVVFLRNGAWCACLRWQTPEPAKVLCCSKFFRMHREFILFFIDFFVSLHFYGWKIVLYKLYI